MKVRCIKNNYPIYRDNVVIDNANNYIVIGSIYHVIGTEWSGAPDPTKVYLLDEVQRADEPRGFPVTAFVPITDISTLEKLLITKPVLEDA